MQEAPQPSSASEDADARGQAEATGGSSVLTSILEGRRFILMLGAMAIVMAVAFLWLSTPRYTATAHILLHQLAGPEMGGNAPLRPVGRDLKILHVGTQARVVASDIVLRRVIAAAGLRNDDEFNAGLRPPASALSRTVLNLLGLRNRSQSRLKITDTQILQALRRRLAVRREPDTHILSVSLYSERGNKAARIANIVAQAYLSQLVADRAARVRAVGEAAQGGLVDLRRQVESAEGKLVKFRAGQKSVATSGPDVSNQKLGEIDAQVVSAQARLADAQGSLQAARAALAHSGQVPANGASRALRELSRRYAAVRARKARLSEQLRARHPDMVALSAEARRLRHQLVRVVGRMVTAAERAHMRAQVSLRVLSGQAEAMRRLQRTSEAANADRRDLVQQLASTRAAYTAARTQVTKAQDRAGKAGVHARSLTAAIAPTERSWPPSSLILLPSALLAGLALGCGLTLLRRRSVAQPASAAAEPHGQGGDLLRAPARSLVFADLRNICEVEMPDETVPPDKDIRAIELATTVVDAPDSVFAQHIIRLYKALRPTQQSAMSRAHSLLIMPDREAPVTSAISLGLALAGTLMGDKVLIVDGDVRRRRLSKSLLVPIAFGLEDVLSGRCKLGDAVIVDPNSKVAVLALRCGASEPATALCDGQAIRRVLSEAETYDLVIIDGAVTEASPLSCALATAVDDLLALVSLGPCSDGAPERAMQELPDAKSNLVGIVLINPR